MLNYSNSFEKRTIEVRGKTVTYLVKGEGKDVVFLHGTGTFPGFDSLADIASRNRLIIPFHPNFSESEDDADIVQIGDYVLHYMDFFDAMGLDRFSLGGFSLGGWIAAEFAIRQPDRLAALFLAAPAGLDLPAIPIPDLFQVAPADIPAHLTHDPAVTLRYFPTKPDSQFDATLGREMGALARVHATDGRGNPKLGHWLHRLNMPTLILWGEEDRVIPAQYGQEWQRGIDGARLEALGATGHLLFEETPVAAALVRDFLSAV
ncbi:alpha/beta fold hydrolase [Brucella pecoris]|uniref:Alpha/beta hydrolase n=1 Tax=Brucella pecoris TaxID=867683 RepID=A0A5C5CWV9_9HYPH|nr:alpha/beta hydrolase [Brucella pecoris]MBB4091917.1 pimeloyl-ACP methyl ester carboxylesterase [Brucella pecoris]TNV15627.1 alpha/beta hydrolase [Brucella pecoris]